jgi:hypothetical protein
MIHSEPLGLADSGGLRFTIAAGMRPAADCLSVVVEKMHLWHLVFEVKNSIVASQERRNNFLFAALERDIYRK